VSSTRPPLSSETSTTTEQDQVNCKFPNSYTTLGEHGLHDRNRKTEGIQTVLAFAKPLAGLLTGLLVMPAQITKLQHVCISELDSGRCNAFYVVPFRSDHLKCTEKRFRSAEEACYYTVKNSITPSS
jgi:hypothetical protein